MNYDHAFHAGNFADVFKHAILARVIDYLKRKPAPFRIIDTHAGSGAYDLTADAATRTGEWRGGIGALDPDAMPAEARALLAPYLAVAEGARGGDRYSGSPALALALARPLDRLLFCELHPAALARLRAAVGRDRRAKVIDIDGYTGLNAFIPPVERRGLVLIDPPFESPDELERMTTALLAAHAKWREGIYVVWYPIKDRRGGERLVAALRSAGVTDALRLELAVARPAADGPLAASGLVVVNPPYVLEAEAACLLPALERQLGGGQGSSSVERL
jgi:23S rRNA (adenine2030-N6)-methyltransferase